MRTLIFGLFGICMFGATVFLFVLLIRALLKYLRSGEVRKEKAEAKKTLGEALSAPHALQDDAGVCRRIARRQPAGRQQVGVRRVRPVNIQSARPCKALRRIRRRAAAGGGGDTAHIEKESL